MIVVIPAYQPDEKLVRLIRDLKAETDYAIVVVNDGSDADKNTVFEAIAPDCTVLTHEVNRGKGAAMKTAFTYIAEHYPETEGIVTVDADGQHLVKDIVRVCEDWAANPDALVLGSRKFTGNVPFKSRTGNAITRFVFRISTGVSVFDTQTGLRAFSVKRVPMMLEMKGDRYEYEINVLLYSTRRKVPIREVWIETVYIEDNKSSHFHPLRDAWRIYKMILLFVASSLISSIIEIVAFKLVRILFPKLGTLFAEIICRFISSYVNYRMNRNLVFDGNSRGDMPRYYALMVLSLAADYSILMLLHNVLGVSELLSKILAGIILYPLNYWAQRRFVFKRKEKADA